MPSTLMYGFHVKGSYNRIYRDGRIVVIRADGRTTVETPLGDRYTFYNEFRYGDGSMTCW